MPGGKPAGVRCIQLDRDNRCRLFGHPTRPAVCHSLQPDPEMCRTDAAQAMLWLAKMDRQTAPRGGPTSEPRP